MTYSRPTDAPGFYREAMDRRSQRTSAGAVIKHLEIVAASLKAKYPRWIRGPGRSCYDAPN